MNMGIWEYGNTGIWEDDTYLVLDKRIWPPVLFELKECLTNRRKSIFSFTFIIRLAERMM